MMSEKKERKKITLFLDEYLEDLLGDNHSIPIRQSLAEQLEIQLKGSQLHHIQFADQYSPDLRKPLLWKYSAWKESVVLWDRQKKRSHDERVARFILEHNVKSLAKILMRDYFMDENTARSASLSMIKKNKLTKIEFFGGKLITKEEEL